MNKEDFVTYEQALDLKKLGFREPCLYYYFNQTLYPNDVYAHRIDRSSFHRVYSVEALSKVLQQYYEPTICDAPTLAQAQKWLRKEKNLSLEPCFVRRDYTDDKQWYCFITNISNKVNGLDDPDLDDYFSTYEEALSAGITECLKLLK